MSYNTSGIFPKKSSQNAHTISSVCVPPQFTDNLVDLRHFSVVIIHNRSDNNTSNPKWKKIKCFNTLQQRTKNSYVPKTQSKVIFYMSYPKIPYGIYTIHPQIENTHKRALRICIKTFCK